MQPDSDALAAAFFLDACAHWKAMQAAIDHGGQGGSSAPLVLLGGAALDMAFKAVLAASGWSASALDAIDHGLEAAWSAALDCGLMPTRVDELGDLMGMIAAARAAPRRACSTNIVRAMPLIGSLIVDVGEQFGSIGQGLLASVDQPWRTG